MKQELGTADYVAAIHIVEMAYNRRSSPGDVYAAARTWRETIRDVEPTKEEVAAATKEQIRQRPDFPPSASAVREQILLSRRDRNRFWTPKDDDSDYEPLPPGSFLRAIVKAGLDRRNRDEEFDGPDRRQE